LEAVKKPKLLFAFDVNNTLDIGGKYSKENRVIPTKQVFSELKKAHHWVGLTSGMNEWMCLQLANKHDIQVDFVAFKHRLPWLRDSIEAFHRCKLKCFLIGDRDEDKWFAGYCHYTFLSPEEFLKRFEEGKFT